MVMMSEWWWLLSQCAGVFKYLYIRTSKFGFLWNVHTRPAKHQQYLYRISWTQHIEGKSFLSFRTHYQWRIQDFPQGGGANSQNCYYFSHFCRKLHENERIWTPRGGASLALPLGSANDYTWKWIFKWNLHGLTKHWQQTSTKILLILLIS